mmetsp:Transcript_68811/g.124039  ORF Transcript_68811/g.124039 Transcript_68811/m.124039 type:complete len:117 (-) Transcript_68811:75-425(-)
MRYRQSGALVGPAPEGMRQMFVIGCDKTLYISVKVTGHFHHSSFLAGGACLAAGYVVVEAGKLKRISPHSGHYRPSEDNFKFLLDVFQNDLCICLSDVLIDPLVKPEKAQKPLAGS